MVLIIVTPGPDTLLVMRNAANSGIGAGLSTVFGIQIGVLFHTGLVLMGATAIIATNATAILVIGILGALFIAYLAWQTWTAGILGGTLKDGKITTNCRAFTDAVITNLFNPKVILAFFAIMLPLVSPTLPSAPQVIAMGLTAAFINGIWQTIVVFGAHWFFRVLTNPRIQRVINRSAAVILLLLAVLLPYQAFEKAQDLREIAPTQPA